MGKHKKDKQSVKLRPDEEREISAILDRLEVQRSNGETLETFITSLKERFQTREIQLACLLDRISRNPSEAGVAVFKKLCDALTLPEARKILRKARYRMRQRGILFEDDAQEKSIHVRVGDKVPEDMLEEPQAFLIRYFINSARVIDIEFPPTRTEDRTLIVCEEKEQEHRLIVNYVMGSKRTVKDVRDAMNRYVRIRIPIPLYHAAACFQEYIDVYEGRYDIVERADFARARHRLKKYTSDNIDRYYLEKLPPNNDIRDAIRNAAKVCVCAGPYDFAGTNFVSCANSIYEIFQSRLEYSQSTLMQLIGDRVFDFFRAMNPWALGRYRMFLRDGVTEWIFQGDYISALHLYEISKRVNPEGLKGIISYLVKQFLSSIYMRAVFAELRKGVQKKHGDQVEKSEAISRNDEIYAFIVAKSRVMFDDVLKEMTTMANVDNLGWLVVSEEVINNWSKIGEQGKEGYRRLESGLLVPE